MSDVERHRRAKALFLELIALPAEARAAALDSATADDDALRAEVESLLRHADAAGEDAAGITVSAAAPSRSKLVAGDLFAGRYRILGVLGRGATGEVYRALDTRLDVEIALKIVHRSSPQAIRRLFEEVRLAREVTHPAVCRVFDADESDGEHFLTMELIDGEDLASLLKRVGRLSSSKVRQIAIELLHGLAAAHARGILHRDLKPSNVMIDGNGSVRVTDFGIASYEDSAGSAPFSGTPAFMAPEQLEAGAPASVQTDLYGVGLILYEALVGRLPASTPAHDNAAPGESRIEKPSQLVENVETRLEDVILRLLARDPDGRPRASTEAADALEATAEPVAASRAPAPSPGLRTASAALAVALSGIAILTTYLGVTRWNWLGPAHFSPTWEDVADVVGLPHDFKTVGVAVLPLADESEKHDQGSLAEGIQDRIIASLAGIRDLRVIADDSSDRFGPTADVEKVGRELGVDFVSAGRIKGSAGDPQVELTLYEVRKGRPVRRVTFSAGQSERLPLNVDQGFVTKVTEMLQLPPADGTSAPVGTANADSVTYGLYLRGREHVPPYSERDFRSSVQLLNQVIERSPRWGEPPAAIATAYVTACAMGWVSPAEGYPKARRYAESALDRDPSLCEAHIALAIVAGEYDWDWAAAEASYAQAARRCPGAAWLHRSRARFLSTQGRFDEASEETSKALELDPTSALMLQGAAQRFYEARRYERAVALARIAKRLDPLYPYTYPTLGFALLERGDHAEALRAFEDSLDVTGNSAVGQARLAYALARAGDYDAARVVAAKAKQSGKLEPAQMALVALAEQDDAAAVAALGQAVETRAPPSIWLAVSPLFDPLRKREDFRALIVKVGLRAAPD